MLSEVDALKTRIALIEAMDATLERAIRDRLSLEELVRAAAPLLLAHTAPLGGQLLLQLPDEEEAMRSFVFGEERRFSPFLTELKADQPARTAGADGAQLFSYPLATAGVPLGVAALWVKEAPDGDWIAALLRDWSEALDNQLASIAQAQRKHRIARATAEALRHPILNEGLRTALAGLAAELPLEQLLLVGHEGDEHSYDSLLYQLVPAPALDGAGLEALIRDNSERFLAGEVEPLARALGLGAARLQLPVAGFGEELVGRLLVAKAEGGFNTETRDLLEAFVDALRQRLVDFNREWKHLSLCFSAPVVRRLLSTPDYRARYLEPREAELTILYADISGFTRISEQVLVDPKLIGRLVDTWSRRVMQILWAHGGVFDKLVGDCVIGLFGPPFYEDSPEASCAAALAAAEEIAAYSRTLDAVIPELAGAPVGVSTGLNRCPGLVGLLGPNDDYTCVSRGMNNTARLQGLAERDEILAMEAFVSALGAPERFTPMRSAPVKNVAEPLRYRSLLRS